MRKCQPSISAPDGDQTWDDFQSVEEMCLLVAVQANRVLLIRKKTGFGAGRIDTPGGRVEAGESPHAAAVREFREEVCANPVDVRQAGRIRFLDRNGPRLLIHVFRAGGVTGTVRETEEAAPMWVNVDGIPYAEMWPDDAHWLPRLLRGEPFDIGALYDGDTLIRVEESH